MVTCIFCGLYKQASVEHVISKWIRYALDLTSSVTIRAEPSGATAHTQHLVVTLCGMVCEECNTGWMHQLEEKVKPFVKPMLINKHGIDLDSTMQRDLARWATMKVLLMEHARRQQKPQLRTTLGYVPSEPELAWIMKEPDPPPRSRVWLGSFETEGKYVIETQARLLTAAAAPGGGNPLPSHMTTLTIGCVLVQVFTTNFVLADVQSLQHYDADPPEPYDKALLRIWPIKQPVVHWPPSHHVSNRVFDQVVNWSQSTTP
jgi:uncharacterized protein YlxP (DUF503 family)